MTIFLIVYLLSALAVTYCLHSEKWPTLQPQPSWKDYFVYTLFIGCPVLNTAIVGYCIAVLIYDRS